MITIVDYDAGNIKSIVNMLQAIGAPSRISADPKEIATADKLILPGVGHFDYGMAQLEERGLVAVLKQRVLEERVPILGICLGAQLLTRGSEEGVRPGLGWIDGNTVRFDRARMGPHLRVPHMGWADVWTNCDHPLTRGLPQDMRFYFVHSYHVVCDAPERIVLTAAHGYEFVAGVGRANIIGVQFHPEKSHRFGMALLRNFVAWEPGRGAAALAS